MLHLTSNLHVLIVVVAVVTNIGIHGVVAYRPSTYTNAPTSLSYTGGVTTTTSAASDAAVANYIRKRYGSSSTMDDGISLKTIYPPRLTETMKNAGVATTENALRLHRNKWGVDHQYANEYWFDKRIHTLGNHGFWGAVHAAMAPISTKVIDMAAYDGIDIRRELSNELSKMIIGNTKINHHRNGFRVVDLCCGVGFSTRALRDAFPQPETTVVGVDTSPEMVAMAKFITNHISTLSVHAKKQYNAMKRRGQEIMEQSRRSATSLDTNRTIRTKNSIEFMLRNAEDTQLPHQSYDLVTVMYAFHEAPHMGRDKILTEARRLLSPGGILAVVDISTEYTPSLTMLQGEPYVQEYQRNIHRQLTNIQGFERPKYRDIVPHHLGMWTLKRSVMV